MKKVKIKFAYLTPFGKLPTDWTTITMEAARAVLQAGDPGRVQDIYIASYAPAQLSGIADPFRAVTRAIQSAFPRLRATYHGIMKTGGDALFRALENMERRCGGGDVLVIGSEKMTHIGPAEVAGILASRENPHDQAYGATLPALGALVTRAYAADFGVPAEAFDLVAVKNHANGALNPKAHFRTPVSVDEVATSPLVADPLRRLHCAPISDGAAAVLLSAETGDTAFLGWGRGADTPLFQDRRNPARFAATAAAARSACEQAGVSARDVNVVEIHDAFSPFELINLEEMGFYAPGTAWHALKSGELAINGRCAVNPSGGKKAEGHPIAATGLSSTVEIVEQLTGRAGTRQHNGATMGMIQSAGGVSDESFVFVIGT